MATTALADSIEQARNSIAASLDSMRSERVRSDFSSSFLARGAAESAASADDWMRSCDERLAATPPDDAPTPAVVASSELPRRPVSPQSAAHYLRRVDAAKPAARKWTP